MTIIGMKELRTNTEEITRRVQAGESFTVVSRSKPLFDIIPSSQNGVDVGATKEWTKKLVEEHRPAFEALADK